MKKITILLSLIFSFNLNALKSSNSLEKDLFSLEELSSNLLQSCYEEQKITITETIQKLKSIPKLKRSTKNKPSVIKLKHIENLITDLENQIKSLNDDKENYN